MAGECSVTWCGTRLIGYPAAQAAEHLARTPSLSGIWMPWRPLLNHYLRLEFARQHAIQRSGSYVERDTTVRSPPAHAYFQSPPTAVIVNGCPWADVTAFVGDLPRDIVTEALSQRTHGPLSVYGTPIYGIWRDAQETYWKSALRSNIWLNCVDLAALGLERFPGSVSLTSTRSAGTFVPLDQVRHGNQLWTMAMSIPAPSILTPEGCAVSCEAIPLSLALRLHEHSPSCNVWFAIPSLSAENPWTFPFGLAADPRVIDVSEWSVDGVAALVSLDGIAEPDRACAAFLHQYQPYSMRGVPLPSLDMRVGAFEKKFTSPFWISQTAVERYELQPKCAVVSAVDLHLKPGEAMTMINLDELEPISEQKLKAITTPRFPATLRRGVQTTA